MIDEDDEESQTRSFSLAETEEKKTKNLAGLRSCMKSLDRGEEDLQVQRDSTEAEKKKEGEKRKREIVHLPYKTGEKKRGVISGEMSKEKKKRKREIPDDGYG